MDWIVNTSTDPAFNLALEEYLLRSVEPATRVRYSLAE